MKKLSAFGSIAGIALITITATFAACVGSDPEVGPGGGGDGGADAGDGGSSDGNTSDAAITCTGGKTACGDSCVDLTSDNDNCGSCGNACSGCYLGTCDGKKVVNVSAGDGFACVVLAAGSVWCWGSNEAGELGVPPGSQNCNLDGVTTICRPAPAEVPGLRDVVQVSAGQRFACATKHDGSVWCWGDNTYGELGHDPATDRPDGGASICAGPCNPTPTQVAVAGGTLLTGMKTVSATIINACAVGPTGVYCWGDDGADERGDGVDTDAGFGGTPYRPASAVAELTSADSVATGSSFFPHTCAIVSGVLWCWGDNYEGVLGHAEGAGTDIPYDGYRTRNPNATAAIDSNDGGVINGIVSVASISGPTCAVRSDHTLSCWGWVCNGANGFGSSGCPNSSTGPFTPGSMVSGISGGVSSVSGVANHACAIAVNGQVYCWGESWGGQIGNGVYSGDIGSSIVCSAPPGGAQCLPTPQQTPGILAKQISAYQDFTLALGTDNVVYGWGVNGAGQAGHAPNTQGDVNCTDPPPADHIAPCNPSPVAVIGLP